MSLSRSLPGPEFRHADPRKAHGCALVIEIMIHGRMYLSNKRICFRSNILGVRTKVSRVAQPRRKLANTPQREIPLKHIHAIVLRNVAGVIPNSFEVHYHDKKVRPVLPTGWPS